MLEDHDWEDNKLPADPEILWDLLLHLGVCISIGSDGVHSRVLKELANVIVGHLSIIF